MTRVFLFHITPLSRLRAIFSAQYLYSPSSLKLEETFEGHKSGISLDCHLKMNPDFSQ